MRRLAITTAQKGDKAASARYQSRYDRAVYYEQEERKLRITLRATGPSPILYIALGRLQRDFGQFEAALPLLVSATRLDPGSPLAWRVRAETEAAAGRDVEARGSVEGARREIFSVA